MIRKLMTAGLFAAILAGSAGCISAAVPPIESDTKLGRVLIYRNGVAYFERRAPIGQKTLTMVVPAARVDDFLKSLTVVDEKSGETMPVSYPTIAALGGGDVEMTIDLPQDHRGLRITYVTESPAWKPSYRVMLGEADQATLQGWAIVDNISGEDWNNVRIGVGSTSALSFRYDLHSVRLVQRETLTDGTLLAAAPPLGGTPYAVAKREERVLGNFREEDLRELTGEYYRDTTKTPQSGGGKGDESAQRQAPRGQSESGRNFDRLRGMSSNLKAGKRRVTVQGYAQEGDDDPNSASLARANMVRDQLLAQGVPADQIEVLGTGKLNNGESARVVETDGEEFYVEQGQGDGQPLGQAHFVSEAPMSIERGHSAMVSILDASTRAQRVYYYDPVSERGSKRFAFNAVRLDNPSEYTLDSGPFTVYAKGQFLGEGLAEPILPKSTAFIPYALDRSIVVEQGYETREEIEKLLTIQRGVVNTETRRIRKTKLEIANRGKDDAVVYVRHSLVPGYTLDRDALGELKADVQKLGGAWLIPITLKGGTTRVLAIEESTPILKTVDIRTDGGVDEMALFVRTSKMDPELRAKLDELIERHRARGTLVEKINLTEEQMEVYRQRVDEINEQLVTLRKVPQADKLKRHLTDKMEEISEKLQQGTIDLSDLKGRLMTAGIELQDKLAELHLDKKKDPRAPEPGKEASNAR